MTSVPGTVIHSHCSGDAWAGSQPFSLLTICAVAVDIAETLRRPPLNLRGQTLDHGEKGFRRRRVRCRATAVVVAITFRARIMPATPLMLGVGVSAPAISHIGYPWIS